MPPVPDSISPDTAVPNQTEVVVIGGGIIGTATALELAERGIPVTLCEKGVIAGEQSGRNWGWCRQMGRDPRELPLSIEALHLWRGMNERVQSETGFRQCGIMYLCDSEQELADKRDWLINHARYFGVDSRMIDASEVARELPGASKPWHGALYTASDGRAEPQKAAPAIARAAQTLGASVFEQCAVRGIEFSGGRVSGVVTEKGSIRCQSVVLAGGAWSRHMCDSIDVHFPQLTVVNSVFRTAPIVNGPSISAAGARLAFRKRLDGGYTVAHNQYSVADIVPASFRFLKAFVPALSADWRGTKFRIGQRSIDEWQWPKKWSLDAPSPFEATRVLNPKPVSWIIDQAKEALIDRYPVFKNLVVAETWAGCIDVTPDIVPVISAVDTLPGFHIASGFSGHGFGIGPAAGRLMADIVTGTEPLVDPTPFQHSRQTDGSKPAPFLLR